MVTIFWSAISGAGVMGLFNQECRVNRQVVRLKSNWLWHMSEDTTVRVNGTVYCVLILIYCLIPSGLDLFFPV